MRLSFSLGFVQCHTTWRKLYFADLPSSESKSPVPGLWLKKLLALSLFQLVVKTLCVPSENKSVLKLGHWTEARDLQVCYSSEQLESVLDVYS